MGVFDRLGTLLKANANKALDVLEGDGEAVMEQELIDAKKEFAQLKQSTAQVIADYNRYQSEYDTHVEKAEKLHSAAAKQLQAGNEDASRELLAAENEERKEAQKLESTVASMKQKAETCKQRLKQYQNQIEQAEIIYRETKANNRVAKATSKVAEGALDAGALDKFNRHAEKARARFEAAEAMADVNAALDDGTGADDLLEKYGTSPEDDSLEALKKELGM